MAKKKRVLFKSKERRDLQSISAFMHQLADKLAEGEVLLRQGADEVAVAVPDNLQLSLKVKEKVKKSKTKHTFKITLKWVDDETSGGVVTLGN
ncbi:MAG: amphi-Trp domain-containing protein [Anaerolineales bacterium]